MKIKKILQNIIGFTWKSDDRYTFTWGEFYSYFLNPKKWTLGFYYKDDDGWDDDGKGTIVINPLFFSFYIKAKSFHKYDCCEQKEYKYGFYIFEWLDISFCWGQKRTYFTFPFVNYNWELTEIINPTTLKVEYTEKAGKKKDLEWDERDKLQKKISITLPYTYTLRNGEIQNVNATVYVTRMQWGRHWFPFLKKSRTSIDVSFDQEVGEERGSWKGGTIGCGWPLKEGQTASEALYDMQLNRKFQR